MFLYLLALAGFVSALSLRALDPMVTLLASDFAVPLAAAALLGTAFTLPYAFGQPFLGPIGDGLGKTRIVKICLVVLALCTATAAMAPTLDLVFAARVAGGLAAGGIIPLALAILGDRFAMAERQVAISRFLVAVIIGQLAGATGAGLLAETIGWRGVLWLLAGITALVALLVGFGMKPQSIAPGKVELGTAITRYKALFRDPRARLCFAAVAVEGIAVYGSLPYIADILRDRGAGGVREAGLVVAGIGIGGLLFSAAIRPMLRRLGMYGMMGWGGLVTALGLAGAAVPGLTGEPAWLQEVAAFVVTGFGFYMIHNSLQTQVTELVPEARGSAVALHAFFFFVGHAAGPIVFGLGYTTLGAAATLLAFAAAMAIAGFVVASRLGAYARIRHQDDLTS